MLEQSVMKHVVAFDYRLALKLGRAREAKYLQVVLLKALQQEGRSLTVDDIALLAGTSPSSVRRIVERYNRLGPDEFVPAGPAPSRAGRKPVLSRSQVARLSRALSTGTQPDGKPWTSTAVQKVIRTHFKVKVSRSTAWRYLLRATRESEQPPLFL